MYGWSIHGVLFEGLTNKPFNQVTGSLGKCADLGASVGSSKGCATGGSVMFAAALLALMALVFSLRRRRARSRRIRQKTVMH